MKTYVYPAIITEDADGRYYISIPDLSLQTIGDSKEDAFVKGKGCLKSYFELAKRFETDIPEPSPYDQIKQTYKLAEVIMLDIEIDDDTKPTDDDIEYRKFMKLFFDEGV